MAEEKGTSFSPHCRKRFRFSLQEMGSLIGGAILALCVLQVTAQDQQGSSKYTQFFAIFNFSIRKLCVKGSLALTKRSKVDSDMLM